MMHKRNLDACVEACDLLKQIFTGVDFEDPDAKQKFNKLLTSIPQSDHRKLDVLAEVMHGIRLVGQIEALRSMLG